MSRFVRTSLSFWQINSPQGGKGAGLKLIKETQRWRGEIKEENKEKNIERMRERERKCLNSFWTCHMSRLGTSQTRFLQVLQCFSASLFSDLLFFSFIFCNKIFFASSFHFRFFVLFFFFISFFSPFLAGMFLFRSSLSPLILYGRHFLLYVHNIEWECLNFQVRVASWSDYKYRCRWWRERERGK